MNLIKIRSDMPVKIDVDDCPKDAPSLNDEIATVDDGTSHKIGVELVQDASHDPKWLKHFEPYIQTRGRMKCDDL